MFQILKKSWWAILLGVGLQSASGFALIGIREPYQIEALGYIDNFQTTPKNIGDGFRWTIPTVYYTYDPTFLTYFGSNGVVSIDQAFAVFNALTNVSSYSTELDEFPLYTLRKNYQAEALRLLDLKSMTMELLIERLGLTRPEDYTWTLRIRVLPPGATCPNYWYGVIQRNFDPVTWAPSAYVNGNLLTYTIVEQCPARDVARTDVYPVDAFGRNYSAVASFGALWGDFYTGLTRDDVGGLRYLYRTNNMYTLAAGEDTFTFVTNRATSQLLVTSNLMLFATQALTNDAAGLQALYPNLVIAATTNYWTNLWITNLTAYLTNYPWDPAGSVPRVAFATNRDLTVQPLFEHTFGNLYTVSNGPAGWVAVQVPNITVLSNRAIVAVSTSYLTNKPYMPAGTYYTNTTLRIYSTNGNGGEVFILPTNACSVEIVALQATLTSIYTNYILSATNDTTQIGNTNSTTGTNVFFYTQQSIQYATNHAFLVHSVLCETNSVATRQGIEKVTFVRRDYDSLLNRFFYPITNFYTLNAVTNNAITPQKIMRVVTRPDILIDAGDLTSGPTTWPIAPFASGRSQFNYVVAGNTNANLGPGTINPPLVFSFNKLGRLYRNEGPLYLDEIDNDDTLMFTSWASFDGTTNAPVVYPDGSSIRNLEYQVFMGFEPDTVSGATAGVPFSAAFTTRGGTAPLSFSLAPNSAGLPSGITLAPNGTLSGTPDQAGTYDFMVRMTDAGARYVDQMVTLIISP